MAVREETRCFVCSARDWRGEGGSLSFSCGRERRFALRCGHCGALADDPAAARDALPALLELLRGPVFDADPEAPCGFDIYTLRSLATRCGRIVSADGADQIEALAQPHSGLAARARLSPFPVIERPPVTLALLCRAPEMPRVRAAAREHAARWADDIVILVDDEPDAKEPMQEPGIRLRRRLGGDFATQRNAAQDLARQPFVLQLDSDESIDADFVAALGGLVETATRDGAVSIGFARKNVVNGVRSDLSPDIQYRLNRRDIRYAGRVHERPHRDWRRSFIALTAPIEHHLKREHVLARSERYEAMAPGEGRGFETAALLTPYRD